LDDDSLMPSVTALLQPRKDEIPRFRDDRHDQVDGQPSSIAVFDKPAKHMKLASQSLSPRERARAYDPSVFDHHAPMGKDDALASNGIEPWLPLMDRERTDQSCRMIA
jgi:hypothetical protein